MKNKVLMVALVLGSAIGFNEIALSAAAQQSTRVEAERDENNVTTVNTTRRNGDRRESQTIRSTDENGNSLICVLTYDANDNPIWPMTCSIEHGQ